MKISINAHSSIRVESDKIIYFDPFQIKEENHDADIIFITHDHFDHFSIEDIRKIEKEDTVYVIPDCMYNLMGGENVITVLPGDHCPVEEYDVEVIPSYNIGKPFHPKDKGYVGYIVTLEGKRIYVAGDCDRNEDNEKVRCDIALLPVGGTYTMDYKEAAKLANIIRPELVIPTHYGEVAGDPKDGERFKELVDQDITVELKI
ncbi:MAG: MBL fold metallo-hydrolase [Erysipelotrichaceae bacterium]|nr:MBL fold metallo-hydrolase [Erysipelotrichaceae bacterium]